jgi:hypothetical protein
MKKRQQSTHELISRAISKERKKFLQKCSKLGIKPKDYDEAFNVHVCAWSPDEYQIGEYKPNTSSTIGNYYVSELEYDNLQTNELC